ncbi:hypothetical protein Tco_0813685, partial [Tanacetum coccineum]
MKVSTADMGDAGDLCWGLSFTKSKLLIVSPGDMSFAGVASRDSWGYFFWRGRRAAGVFGGAVGGFWRGSGVFGGAAGLIRWLMLLGAHGGDGQGRRIFSSIYISSALRGGSQRQWYHAWISVDPLSLDIDENDVRQPKEEPSEIDTFYRLTLLRCYSKILRDRMGSSRGRCGATLQKSTRWSEAESYAAIPGVVRLNAQERQQFVDALRYDQVEAAGSGG